jgi:transcriptional regulator with XRE-family HTH domain
VINVALLGIIRRWHLRDQIPIREIARRLDISRNTVRRYLRSETTEPSYAERRSISGLDKYSVRLSGWLKAETTKPRKQRRNLKQIHEDLKELGYEGSYDRMAAFARQWKAGQTDWVNSASKRTVIVFRLETEYYAPKVSQTHCFIGLGTRIVAGTLRFIRMAPSRLDFN